jgi:hypothetical protein
MVVELKNLLDNAQWLLKTSPATLKGKGILGNAQII